MKLIDCLKTKKDLQIMYPKSDVEYPFKLKYKSYFMKIQKWTWIKTLRDETKMLEERS